MSFEMDAVVAGCQADTPEGLETCSRIVSTRVIQVPSISKFPDEREDAPAAVEGSGVTQIENDTVPGEFGRSIGTCRSEADPLMSPRISSRVVESYLVVYADCPRIHAPLRIVWTVWVWRKDRLLRISYPVNRPEIQVISPVMCVG